MIRNSRTRRLKRKPQGYLVSGTVEQFLKYWVTLPLAVLLPGWLWYAVHNVRFWGAQPRPGSELVHD